MNHFSKLPLYLLISTLLWLPGGVEGTQQPAIPQADVVATSNVDQAVEVSADDAATVVVDVEAVQSLEESVEPGVAVEQDELEDAGVIISGLEEEAQVTNLRRYSSDDIHRKNWDRALGELRQLVTLRPYHADYHLTLGLIHRRLEDIHNDGLHLEEAFRKFEEYIDFGGEDAIAALLMAEAFAYQGQREEAFQQLEKAASYGMNIARAVQQFPTLKSYTSDTRFVRAALRLERYNLSTVVTRDPFTGPWSQSGSTPGVEQVGPLEPGQQSLLLAEAREAMDRVLYALRNGDQVSAMDAYAKIEDVGNHLNRFDVPELSSELRSILERLDELEDGIDQIRVAYLYEHARSKMESMRIAFEEQQFDLVNQTHGEVVTIAQDISLMGDTYQAASMLVIQAADQFQQRSDIVREFQSKQVSVEGVVVAEEGSHAIINAELVPEGGSILGGMLESVQRDRVVILYRGEQITHKFGRF
ncbi:MAG: hypothetical protein OSB09_07080 [Planctomycetota bacterium]|nr:hypothetical protein [Planctomycetota bacterium]